MVYCRAKIYYTLYVWRFTFIAHFFLPFLLSHERIPVIIIYPVETLLFTICTTFFVHIETKIAFLINLMVLATEIIDSFCYHILLSWPIDIQPFRLFIWWKKEKNALKAAFIDTSYTFTIRSTFLKFHKAKSIVSSQWLSQ